MTAKISFKEIGLNMINKYKTEIDCYELYIMRKKIDLVQDLNKAEDVNDVYRAIENAMNSIEEYRNKIDYYKNTIVSLYDKIMEEEE